jgi:hypothetical protein
MMIMACTVIEEPPIRFRCDHCGALNQGPVSEFKPRYTSPPSWYAECGFCHNNSVCYPTPMIAKHVGELINPIGTLMQHPMMRFGR